MLGKEENGKVKCFSVVKAAKGIGFRMGKWRRFKTYHPLLSRPSNLIFHEEEVNVDKKSVKYLQEK